MRSLKEILDRFSAAELSSLKERLGLKIAPERLVATLNQSTHTQRLFGTLSPLERMILRYMLSQGGHARSTELHERFPGSDTALKRLVDQALLFTEGNPPDEFDYVMPREYTRYIALGPEDKTTLAFLLSLQPPATLTQLATHNNIPFSTKERFVADLKTMRLNKTALETLLATLPAEEKILWDKARKRAGTLEFSSLRRLVGSDLPLRGTFDPQKALEGLFLKGLLLPDQLPQPTSVIIPSDILTLLLGAPVSTLIESADRPPQLRSWGSRLLSDLQLFAAFQGSGRLQFTQNNLPQRRQIRTLLKAISVADENYGLFMNAMIDTFFAGVVRKDPVSFDHRPEESLAKLLSYWRDTDAWQESSHYRDKNRLPEGQLDKSLVAKRFVLLKALADLPETGWVDYKAFSDHVFKTGWQRVEGAGKPNTAFYHNERALSRRFVPDLAPTDTLAAMVGESLLWLGVVELGSTENGKKNFKITHLRLTEWGNRVVRHRPFSQSVASEPEKQFRVLANLEIKVPPRLDPSLLMQLFKFADLRDANSFTLTQESLRPALDEGQTPAKLMEFLTAHSLTPISEMVSQFIDEVGQKHGHIKLGFAGAYLEVDDPYLLVELKSRKSLKGLFHKQVGDRLSLLSHGDLERVAKELRKLGYLPIVEKAPSTDTYSW